jgi:cold shock CspA family protein
MAGRYSGIVKSWNGSKGYGFLSSQQINGDIMFLRSHLPTDAKEVRGKFLEGKTVNFDLTTGPDGRAQGANIQITAVEGDFVAGEVKTYSERHGYGFIISSSLKGEVRFNRTDLDALNPGEDFSMLSQSGREHSANMNAVALMCPLGTLEARTIALPSNMHKQQQELCL